MSDVNVKQKQSEDFWAEVIHRSNIQLSGMNTGIFHQWRATVGDREIHRLLSLMELLLSPDNHKFEIVFFIKWINCRINGPLLFSSFRTSGRTLIRQGMKGEIYCIPVLYVIIRYLTDDAKSPVSSNQEKYWRIDFSQIGGHKTTYQKPGQHRGFVT
ncbi:hypothetical protein P3N87_004475 [Salmonella enterica]|nr:hypothetical protein [Salmonella enterica]EGG3945757.1 hypothetical protein [Salmonella enterica]EKP5434241.1 hypothetical protein [Salmonella enterica]HCK5321734.1 hypothetical protein [Salmonella enterica subsp. enterica serovar Manhattan]